MSAEALRDAALSALASLRAHDVVSLNIGARSGFADWCVIATATSVRHARALTDRLCEALATVGVHPLGIEGRDDAEWILVDCGELVAHIMQSGAREFYDLERLWGDAPPMGPAESRRSG